MPNVIYDQYGRVMDLAKVTEFVPGPKNDQAVELQVPTSWAREQRCPEHGTSWTHVRAHWVRTGRSAGEMPAVMFRCPKGHVCERVIPKPGEGSYV